MSNFLNRRRVISQTNTTSQLGQGTSALLHLDDNSNDAYGNYIFNNYGNVLYSSTPGEYKWGQSFAQNGLNGGLITELSSKIKDLVNGDFTLECWLHVLNVTDATPVHRLNNHYDTCIYIGYNYDNNLGLGKLRPYTPGTEESDVWGATNHDYFFGWVAINGAATPNVVNNLVRAVYGNWYHLAMVKNGTSVKWYVNGTIYKTSTLSSQTIYTQDCRIAIAHDATYIYPSRFQLDDVRISDYAVYNSTFTPPTISFSDIPGPTSSDNWNSTKLLMGFDSGIIDQSISNYIVYPQQGAITTHEQSKQGGNSLKLVKNRTTTALSQYVTIDTPTALNVIETQDFTIECWVNFNQVNGGEYQGIYSGGGAGSGQICNTTIVLNGSNHNICFWDGYNGENTINTTTTIVANTWYHVAVCRNTSFGTTTTRLFINGVSEGTPLATIRNITENTIRYIGSYSVNGGDSSYDLSRMDGYIDNLRVLVGQGIYRNNFSPPATIYLNGDSFFNNVVALLHFNGNTLDVKQHAVTNVNGATISTTTTKFGGGSLTFVRNSLQCLTLPGTDFEMGGNDFTAEVWVYLANVNVTYYYVLSNVSTSDSIKYAISVSGDGFGEIGAFIDNVYFSEAGVPFPRNEWQHVALTKSGTTGRLFRNGKLVASATVSATISNSNNVLSLGAYNGSGLLYHFDGYLDDVRITKGTCRYTSEFMTPTNEYYG